MWKYDKTSKKWNKKVEELDKENYNYFREELDSYRFYSKCLNGTTYVPINNLLDIYDILKYKDLVSRNVNLQSSTYYYPTSDSTTNGVTINSVNNAQYGDYDKYKTEYGLTLKNLFTPKRVLDDTLNYLVVDVATTEEISINDFKVGDMIDGIIIKEGHRILIKDQITTITLDSSVNPDEYFEMNYYINTANSSSIATMYYYYDNTNGIYKFENGSLIREDDLDDYQDNIRYSVNVKLGSVNKEKQLHLSRMKSGLYPVVSKQEPIEFTEKNNWIVRNKIQYQNIREIDYKHGLIQQESNLNNSTVPYRRLYVGDFGTILNEQDGHLNFIRNKYKKQLNHITSDTTYYYIAGNDGLLLKMSKSDLIPNDIELGTYNNLNSVDFFNDQRGIVVGEYGTIYYTLDGNVWKKLNNNYKTNFNDIKFTSLNKATIVGDNGMILKLELVGNNNWNITKENVVRVESQYDEYDIIENLNNITYCELSTYRFNFLDSNQDYIDVPKSIGNSDFSIDFYFYPTDLSTITSGNYQTLLSYLPRESSFTVDNYDGFNIIIANNGSYDTVKVNIVDNTNNNTIELVGNVKLIENIWYHVALTRKNSNYSLYMEKALSDSTTLAYDGGFSNISNIIRVGGELIDSSGSIAPSGGIRQFNGIIDELRLWNIRLSLNEVIEYSELYNVTPSELEAYYTLTYTKSDDLWKINNVDKTGNLNNILSSSANYESSVSGISDINQTYINNEENTGYAYSGDDKIYIDIDNSTNYLIFETTNIKNIKNVLYDINTNDLYGMGDNLFNIDLNLTLYNRFNKINLTKVSTNIILENSYNHILLDNTDNSIVLISNSDYNIDKIEIGDICYETNNTTDNSSCFVFPTIDDIDGNSGISIYDYYRNSFTSSNTNEINYIKTLGYEDSATQSLVEIFITSTASTPLMYNEEYCTSFEIQELINGNIEVSLNGIDWISYDTNGVKNVSLFAGGASKISFRCKLADNYTTNKVSGKVINIKVGDSSCCDGAQKYIYNGGSTNIQKLYFPQFETDLNNLPTALYSWIDIKSLKLNNVEKITSAYTTLGLPNYLYQSNFVNSILECDVITKNCLNSGSGDTYDRFQNSLNLTKDGNGVWDYSGATYGFLESFNFGSGVEIGIDRSTIAYGENTLKHPFYMNIDFGKSFEFEVDSYILYDTDLINDDITNGSSPSNNGVSVGAGVSYISNPSYFNYLEFTSSGTYSINLGELEQDRLYLIEFDTIDNDTTVDVNFGTYSISQSTTGITSSYIRYSGSSPATIDFIVGIFGTSTVKIGNIVVTDKLPNKNIIKWDKSLAENTHTINGIDITNSSFLEPDGSGTHNVQRELYNVCDNNSNLTDILTEEFLSKYNSKLLYLNYDMGAKLNFFDPNGNYRLPNDITINNVKSLTLSPLDGELNWLSYTQDETKLFKYADAINDSNMVKTSYKFNFDGNSTINFNNSITNDINEIGELFPTYYNGTVNIGDPIGTYSMYIYKDLLAIRNNGSTFSAAIGDIVKIDSDIITTNLKVIRVENTQTTDEYIYLKTEFNDSIINSLVSDISLGSTVSFINLNKFETSSELISRFNKHPISEAFKLIDNGTNTTLTTNFNEKTSYYNLQTKVGLIDFSNNITHLNMVYEDKFLNFGYSPSYNILDYLVKNSTFTSSYIFTSMPQYRFTEGNSEVVVADNKVSFNSSLEFEWDTFFDNTFIDVSVDNTITDRLLIVDKYYSPSDDRYILECHKNIENPIGSGYVDIRSRNKLSEISSDLQMLNNIHRSNTTQNIYGASMSNLGSYTKYDTELKTKFPTDSYAKILLSDSNIKSYLTGIMYTDFKNDLAFNLINLFEEKNQSIDYISAYATECESCTWSDYQLFNGNNQVEIWGATYYYNSVGPSSLYGFNNQINILNLTSASVSFGVDSYATVSGTQSLILNFKVDTINDIELEILKGTTPLHSTISSSSTFKIPFVDDGVKDVSIKVLPTDSTNSVKINDIRVGNEYCDDVCYITQVNAPSHGLSIGDGIHINIQDDIIVENEIANYTFSSTASSGWSFLKYKGATISSYGIVGLTSGEYMSATAADGESNYLISTQLYNFGTSSNYKFNFDSIYYDTVGVTSSVRPMIISATAIDMNSVLIDVGTSSTYVPNSNTFMSSYTYGRLGFLISGSASVKLDNISLIELLNNKNYYDGYSVVEDVVDSNNFIINKTYIGGPTQSTATYSFINACGEIEIGNVSQVQSGTFSQYIYDPYLNFQPIDIMDVGIDQEVKKSVLIKEKNYVLNNDETVSLIDLDLNKYKFKLLDNLSLPKLNDEYPWILEAELEDAVIGQEKGSIVFYKGIWHCGRWFGSTWYSGVWRNGQWYGGTFSANNVTIGQNTAKIDKNINNNSLSLWYNGDFRGGNFNNSTWLGGNFYNGNIIGTEWYGGTFHNGYFDSSTFSAGLWVDGTFNLSTFNSAAGESNWLYGTFIGNFQNGNWYDGIFRSTKSYKSKFGTKATNSRKAIWKNGTFINGEFHSYENTDPNTNKPLPSLIHKYSNWQLGRWLSGDFYGGNIDNINFNSGTFHEGVVNKLDIHAFYANNTIKYFIVKGDWDFNIGDEFYVLDYNSDISIFGANVTATASYEHNNMIYHYIKQPTMYKVDNNVVKINNGEYTKIPIDKIPPVITDILTNESYFALGFEDNTLVSDDTVSSNKLTNLVSKFSKCTWENGIFQGIFDGFTWVSGTFLDGIFSNGQYGT